MNEECEVEISVLAKGFKWDKEGEDRVSESFRTGTATGKVRLLSGYVYACEEGVWWWWGEGGCGVGVILPLFLNNVR